MADENQLSQEEIEQLLAQSGMKRGQPSPSEGASSPEAAPSTSPPTSGGEPTPTALSSSAGQPPILDQKEIEALLSGSGPKSAASSPPSASLEASDAEKVLSQEEIERLLAQAGRTAPSPKPAATPQESQSEPSAVSSEIAPADLEYLLRQAEQALASVDAPAQSTPPGVTAFRLEEFSGAPPSTEAATLDLIRDVELDLRIELGRTHMYLEDVLRLRRGSVVPLDKLAGDPVDIYVNDRLIARGEVLVLNDNFCVRVAELLAGIGPENT